MFAAEIGGRAESIHIALRGVVAHGIGPADRLKRAIGAACDIFGRPQPRYFLYLAAIEQIFVTVAHSSQTECVVAVFGQHTRFIGGIDISVIVIYSHSVYDARRRLQIDEADRKRSQYFAQYERCKLFDEYFARRVDFDDIFQRLLVECDESVAVSSPVIISFANP